MKKNISSRFLAVFILIFAFLLILFSKSTADAAYNAIISLIKRFIPSIFPFLVISNAATQSGVLRGLSRRFGGFMRIFKFPPAASESLAVGLISGFPTGAISAAGLFQRKEISKADAELLMGICNLPGPAFVISAVGIGSFGSLKVGIFIYLSVIASSYISGIILSFFQKFNDFPPQRRCFFEKSRGISLFTDSVKGATVTMAYISAFIVFFAVILSVLESTGVFYLLPAPLSPLFYGFFEITAGIRRIGGTSAFYKASAAAVLAFSGISVFLQTVAAVNDKQLSFKKYLAVKALASIFAFFITYFIFISIDI